MTVEEAQQEVRSVYMGGFTGLLVSGALWAVSASLGAWVAPRPAILVLVLGGVLIHPLSQLFLRTLGRPSALSSNNPMRHLAMQAAFIIPATLPVVAAAVLHQLNWFYPSLMVVVGAHYLPFAFLYGMPQYMALGGTLIAAGVAIAVLVPTSFSLGGWIATAVFLLAAFPFRQAALAEPSGP